MGPRGPSSPRADTVEASRGEELERGKPRGPSREKRHHVEGPSFEGPKQ